MKKNLFAAAFFFIACSSTAQSAFVKSAIQVSTSSSILLVSGIIHKNGGLEKLSLHALPSGIIDHAQSGSYSIRVLDFRGGILYKVSFGILFQIVTDSPMEAGPQTSSFKTTTSSFGFSVPYPRKAATVQIHNNEKILGEFQIAAKLLQDSENSIPDSAFVQNPQESRKEIQRKIDLLDGQLKSGNFLSARKTLIGIYEYLKRNLVDGYEVKNIMQYSKPAVLALATELLDRLMETPNLKP